MAKQRRIARSSGSGEFVTAAEAKAKPGETSVETIRPDRDDGIVDIAAILARLDRLEEMIVLGEAHARNAYAPTTKEST